ncbi:methylated-DNA--[protein]-cysteine S-methyltransferase [Geochorda subterranea]|uniref:Methylated-DNA--[protein]-cysteine S-methyltransferase n=1 Tax=Geochorda subterranea TaxID=3109564 RepID=A0ABZ1BQ24_9FIRM|nr:methylated-DNA--[protein]-cysteine S-methyltransferase [Limnochorda sp. LNt]WRP14904.1 methylated-DNA--[protein]-cysteine S-methyltransferase [Limnochorda sp. LNt]
MRRQGRRGRSAPQGAAAASSAGRGDEPGRPLHLAWTEAGLVCACVACSGPEALLAEMHSRYGRRLGSVRLEPGEAAAVHRWEQAVRAWFETGAPPPLDLRWVTPFERRVMGIVCAIPRGQVRTYGEVARAASRPGAARAVGRVMATNPIPLFVPCHRVVPAAGGLGQYSGGGTAVKARLLALEGYPVRASQASTSARAESSDASQKLV